jgi:hypothetical protein
LRRVRHYIDFKDESKENIVATYQGAPLPRCVGRCPKDHQQRATTTSCWVSRSQWQTITWWLLGNEIVYEKSLGDQEEVEVRGSDMIEVGSLFQLDMCSKDADIVGLRNLDGKRLVRQVTVNETVEAEKLHVGRRRGHFEEI